MEFKLFMFLCRQHNMTVSNDNVLPLFVTLVKLEFQLPNTPAQVYKAHVLFINSYLFGLIHGNDWPS